ncbi:MAG TPA: hypothetical protein ENN18_02590 [Proteobacteria bacterium]|nr:hypothetical protein [Pseudomonadota bacterium]
MPRFTIKLADSCLNLGAFYDLEKPLPFMVRLLSQTGTQGVTFPINDRKTGTELSEDPGTRVAFFQTPELPEGLYRLEIYSPFTNRPLIVQDNLRLGPKGSTFKFSLPDSEIDTDDPKLQANTVAMDVLADAPYCLRKRADGILPDLPVLILVKDIPDDGVTIKSLEFRCRQGGKTTVFPPGLIKNLENFPFERRLKPTFGPSGSGLGETPWWFLLYIDTKMLYQAPSTYLSRGAYSGYSSVDFLEFEVEIGYQGRWWIHHSSTTVLRTMFLNPLPQFEDWCYGDTHYHSIYTENPAEFGGPLIPTAEVARAVGLDWLFLTDHSWDFTWDKNMRPLKPEEKWLKFLDWAPTVSTQQGPDSVLIVPAEEITVRTVLADPPQPSGQPHSPTSEPCGLALHMLSFEAGPEGLVQDHFFIGEFTLSETLAKLAEAAASSPAKPLVFAAHPGSTGYPWGSDDCAQVKQSPLFGGLQVFNERVTCERKVFGIDVHEYDIYSAKVEPKDKNPYKELDHALEKVWRDHFLLPTVQNFTMQSALSCTILGGSDAHMDFNFALRPNPIYVLLIFTDNAFGKVRTLAYIPGFKKTSSYAEQKELLVRALRRGCCVVTDGPVVIPTLVITHKDNTVTRLVCGVTQDENSPFYSLQEGDSFALEYQLEVPEESRGVKTEIRLFYPQKRDKELFEAKDTIDITQGRISLDSKVQSAREFLKAIYFRIECNTVAEDNKMIGYCCTNPIWITWE